MTAGNRSCWQHAVTWRRAAARKPHCFLHTGIVPMLPCCLHVRIILDSCKSHELSMPEPTPSLGDRAFAWAMATFG
jgi:hypothetical protein